MPFVNVDCVIVNVPQFFIAPPAPYETSSDALFPVNVDCVIFIFPLLLLYITPPRDARLSVKVDCLMFSIPLLNIAPPNPTRVLVALFVIVDCVIVNVPWLIIVPPYCDSPFFIVMLLRTTEVPFPILNTCFLFPSIVCPLPLIVITALVLLNVIVPEVL